MNRAGLEALLSEIATRLEGRRVARMRGIDDDTTALELADPSGDTLVVSTSPALPLVYLDSGRGPSASDDPPEHLRSLRGAVLEAVGLGPAGPVAVAEVRRTGPVGLESGAAVVIDLGRRPSFTIEGAAHRVPVSGPDETPHRASVSWWRDDPGRLHVRIGASPHRSAEESRTFESWNDAARFAYVEHASTIRDDHRRKGVLRTLTRDLKRKRRAIERVRRGLERAEKAPELRARGQMLLTRKHEFTRGQTLQRLTDYDGASTVEVEVDPRLGPVENAETFFRRARKAERVLERSPQRLAELEREVERIEREIEKTRRAGGEALGRLKDRHTPPERKRPRGVNDEKIRFRRYTVSGGWEVLVGKSNRDNDLLTQRVAAPSDLWFHARQAPGSHVVLRRAGRKEQPDRRAILETAAIAAYHSKAGKSSKVAVLYTEKRHVRKPRGAKPGLVTVSRENVVLVRPALPEDAG